ncbi:MAG: hypothetical protein EB084_03495 [Proteobacteria bacterium]|nr:hypothetical protein [Pseudomonadota bacterium]
MLHEMTRNVFGLLALVVVAIALQTLVSVRRQPAAPPATAAPTTAISQPAYAPPEMQQPPGFVTPKVPAEAPGFTLSLTSGGQVTLDALRAKGPVLLCFFKIECPTSREVVPRYETFEKQYAKAGKPLQMLGIAQNETFQIEQFARESKLTFPIAVDTPGCEISAKYGILNTPTLVLIAPDGKTLTAIPSWTRSKVNALSEQIAAMTGAPYLAISTADDGLQEWRPG